MASSTIAPVGCYGHTHVWDWPSNSTNTDTRPFPPPKDFCMCGGLTWEQAHLMGMVVDRKKAEKAEVGDLRGGREDE